MKKVIALIAFLGLFLGMSGLRAQNFNTCDQWGSWNTNGYTIYNNIWGSGAGSQCLWAYSPSNWGVTADHPNTGGIKSYPNVDRDVNYTVNSMPNITASFNVSRPGWGSYNTAFDIWYNNYGYEIMLWMNWNGSMGPISYNYGCGGYPSSACPIATNINVGGHTWNLYEGDNGSATVYSFLRTSNTNSGTVNITQISQWLANNGYFSGNTNLHEIQFGFEISQSAGGADFTVNNYSVNIGGGNGGGGGSGYVQLQNRGSGLFLDGMGRTNNGDACGQWGNTNHPNSHWQLIDVGSGYYQLKNRGTGLFLDGMGRTSNGAVCGQWGNTSHHNSHWELEQYSGNYYRLQNRGTGLYLDGMGRTSNGSDVGQWPNTTHPNAQWQLINVSARFDNAEAQLEGASTVQLYPNPAQHTVSVNLPPDMKRSTIVVYNSLGKLMMTREANSDRAELNVAGLKSGIYILRAIKDERIVTTRFTKL